MVLLTFYAFFHFLSNGTCEEEKGVSTFYPFSWNQDTCNTTYSNLKNAFEMAVCLAQNFVLCSLSLSFFSCFHFQKTISPSPQRLAKSIKYPKQVLFNFLKGFYRVGRMETRLKCVIERKCNKGGRVTTIALSGLKELF